MPTSANKKNNPGFFGRLLRSLLSITILTALVLGIAYSVKQLSTLSPQKLVRVSTPLLDKLGVDSDKVQKLGEVAGVLIEKTSENTPETTEDAKDAKVVFTAAIMSDAENDTESFAQALKQAKEKKVEAVFYLGDFTNWGDEKSLQTMKDILDDSDLIYYAIPGDHDLAASVKDGDQSGLLYFKKVFGNNFHSIMINSKKFVMLDNSANFTTISVDLMDWFKTETDLADFVMLSQPLYHPIIKLVMGTANGEEVPNVKAQADDLLQAIRQSDTKAIIAADQHTFSKNTDPEKPTLQHIVTGALVKNDGELRNPQTPRFTLLEIYDNDTFKVKEIVLD